ncbi:MAG: AsmA family protein [Betaproteobacteria bacterium]
MLNLRSAGRWSLWTGAGLAALLLLTLVVLTLIIGLFHISIDAAPWRARLSDAISHALGREVTLEGPLELTLSLHPALTVGGLHVANPPGFSHADFATFGVATFRVDLLPLLRRQMHVRDLQMRSVHVRPEQLADGRVNWNFTQDRKQPDEKNASAQAVKLEQIDRIELRSISVDYITADRTRRFALEQLVGQGALGKPIAITLNGTVEQRFPYTLTLTGGPLANLYVRDQPWPVQLSLAFAGTALQAEGNITNPITDPSAQLTFGLGTEDLTQLERLLQVTFPPVGASALSALVQWKSRHLDIANLRGVMGRSQLDGNLHVDLTADKPRITGELSMAVFDLRPFVGQADHEADAPQANADAKPANQQTQTKEQTQAHRYNLQGLGSFDAELQLGVAKWLGIPGEVRDTDLRISLEHAILKAPIRAVVADVPLTGALNLDATNAVPEFSLQLKAGRSSLGRLAEVFARVRGVQGNLDSLALQLKGRGNNLAGIVRALDLRFDLSHAALSYGNDGSNRSVAFKLDALQIAIPANARLTGTLRGSLLGTPFQARIKGGDIPTLAREIRWPLEVDANASGATLHLHGVIAPPSEQAGTDLDFRLEAKRVADVARWLGLARVGSASVAIAGHVRVESDEWHLQPFNLQIGKTAMTGAFARTGIGAKPLVRAQLDIDNLDVVQLERMLPPPDPKAPVRSSIDVPILPQGISLFDTDLDVKIKRVRLRKAPLTDVAFAGRIRDGRMWPSPFSAKIADTPFSGAAALDLRGQIPEASLWVASENADIGHLLNTLGAVQDLQAHAQLLRMEMIGRGSRLGEMLERSSLLAELETGELTVHDPNGKWAVPIQIDKGVARAEPGKPVGMDLDGRIETTPISIRITSGALPEFMRDAGRVPFSLAATAAQTQMEMNGSVALPITQRDVQLSLSVRGKRLDSLNQLARVALPPWGPWDVAGQLRISDSGYQVSDLALKIGESTLTGHGSLDTTAARPRLDVALRSPRIQLNDFKLDGWSAFQKKENAAAKPLTADELRAKTREAAQQGQKLLSAEVMRKLDASVDVDVEQVVSGADRLGSGSLRTRLIDGRLALDPAEVKVPGGSARMTFVFEPTQTDVALSLGLLVDRFDYGIVARRLKPETELQGLFSMRVDIDARSPTLETVLQHANGRIDFAVWPRNFKSGIFDLWAVNLFLALIPAVDSSKESKVNCAVGRFSLRDGKLTHDLILLDTSRMRVTGQGNVDFASERLAFRLVPTAKSPQFFSVATPIGVSGTISHYKVGVSGSDMLETTARLLTSVVVVPLQKLIGRGLPKDGRDVCEAALNQPVLSQQ